MSYRDTVQNPDVKSNSTYPYRLRVWRKWHKLVHKLSWFSLLKAFQNKRLLEHQLGHSYLTFMAEKQSIYCSGAVRQL